MLSMTIISAEATTARESARATSGQFGTQDHTAPELALAADPAAALQDAWDARQALAREVEAATVNLAVSHMPDNIKGIRFVERDGQLIPALFIPIRDGGDVAGVDRYEQQLMVVTALAHNHSDYVELEPITERSGNPAWEWIPGTEQRDVPVLVADAVREDAVRRFREADYDFNDASADYLRGNLPDGVDTLEVAFAPVKGARGYESVPTPIAAYDEDGELVMFDIHAREFADFRVNLARTAVDQKFPVHFTETTNAAVYTISREG